MAGTIMHQSSDEADLTPEEHLERDWHLFREVETGAADELCRTWKTRETVVVVGHGSAVADQVIGHACDEDGVRVLRRFTGGGAVVLGPGCMNYVLALSLVSWPQLSDVAASFQVILQRVVAELGVAGLSVSGETDLAMHGRKVSGNAQRRGRRALIHHGTLLYDFDPRVATRYLTEPLRQPPYRATRRHADFLSNIPLSPSAIQSRLEGVWEAFGIKRQALRHETRIGASC